jgi:exodeoxyribonuclease VIII
MKNVMVDLETLGNGSNAVIIALGAVEFGDGELGRTFYTNVDPQSCVDAGLKMDVSTVMWWMQQTEQSRAIFKKLNSPLRVALDDFATWYPSGAALWGNGATFDNVILANAYRALGGKQPWEFWNDRCYRTLKSLYPHVKLERTGVAHNALDDAKSQALHALKLLTASKGL